MSYYTLQYRVPYPVVSNTRMLTIPHYKSSTHDDSDSLTSPLPPLSLLLFPYTLCTTDSLASDNSRDGEQIAQSHERESTGCVASESLIINMILPMHNTKILNNCILLLTPLRSLIYHRMNFNNSVFLNIIESQFNSSCPYFLPCFTSFTSTSPKCLDSILQ